MRFKKLFSNVYLLSLIPFAIILIFFPIKTRKYILEILKTEVLPSNYYIFYDDLENDGYSEKIMAFDDFNSSGLTISNDNVIIDQWNFRGTFGYSIKRDIFITGDRDGDNKKEIYIFTLSKDSIYLSCISNIRDPELEIEGRFIAITGKGKKAPDPFIIPAEMEDLDGDGIKELIFGIGTGFSLAPRRVFAYYIRGDSLVKSPESSYFIQKILQADLNNDEIREIIPIGYAAGNVRPEIAEYHDHSSFLMVLDKDLKFLYPPVEFSGKYSSLTPFLLNRQGKTSLAALFAPASQTSSTVMFIGPAGNITDSTSLGFYCSHINLNKDLLYFTMPAQGFGILDNNLKLSGKMVSTTGSKIVFQELDKDGKDEILIYDPGSNSVMAYREGFRYPASAEIPLSVTGWEIISMKNNREADPVISMQAGTIHYQLGYSRNSWFYFSFLFYPAIYFGIFGFVQIILTIQKDQMKKRYENEKKVSELQLALIRNQLDPHFILNAINSIIYSVDYDDRHLAADRLRCFTVLYRDLVLSAGSSRRSLGSEIAFCENYLSLEKMRFGEKFDYNIDIGDSVDQDALIPKFLIQIHAENALKHGLAPLESGGRLIIKIEKTPDSLVIEITDNGVGRKNSQGKMNNSTGKGLAIMDELYSLYFKLYSERIFSEITDLYDHEANPAGTRVVIKISKSIDPARKKSTPDQFRQESKV